MLFKITLRRPLPLQNDVSNFKIKKFNLIRYLYFLIKTNQMRTNEAFKIQVSM